MQCLVQIKTQNKRIKRMAEEAAQKDSKPKPQSDAIDPNFFNEQRKHIEDHPQEKAELYDQFLKRVKKNFHLIFNFSPSGADFRGKMEAHKQLMLCSQMIWIQNLNEADLHAIGSIIFVQKTMKEAQEKAKQQGASKEVQPTDAYEI